MISIRTFLLVSVFFSLGFAVESYAADEEEEGNPLATLPLRHIGPAITSGRISDFAFYPGGEPDSCCAVRRAICSDGEQRDYLGPVFEKEGSYAIGVVELDPNDTKTIWVGTGENNAQRSVAYGDGVYKSIDGGKSWENVGLEDSGHISQIWINPDDSDEVLVAAQGPLWNDGGDRGLYRTTDGGATWDRILDDRRAHRH